MSKIRIKIATDFSNAPGARYIEDGPDSGQKFYESCLKPKFEKALETGQKLIIDMDGTYGYATSFISEAFGKLSEEFTVEVVLNNIKIISEEDPLVASYTIKTIKDPTTK